LQNIVAIATLGCKVNQYESAVIRESFQKRGWEIVPFSSLARVYVINTCTVTRKTDYQSRQLIRRAQKQNPSATIIVTGCYAQISPEEIKKIKGVGYILGNSRKDNIIDLIYSYLNGNLPKILVDPIDQERKISASAAEGLFQQTRPPVKIQDGCNSACSYCIIPSARGKSRSKRPGAVIEEISHLANLGYKEAVLTGIHLGAYGLDLHPKASLLDLLRKLEEKRIINRIRISSIEPTEIGEELIDLVSVSKIICPHFHIALQSGDDKILKQMNRTYRAQFFSELIQKLNDKIPHLAVGIDVIAGFPGEREREFENTLELLKQIPFSYLHVFPFSRRPGTVAAELPDQIHGKIIRERCRILRDLGELKRKVYYQRFLNQKLDVLIEAKRDPASKLLKGFSRNYIPVLVRGKVDLVNSELRIKVEKIEGAKVFGTLIPH